MLFFIPGKRNEPREKLRSQPKECATEGSLSISSSVPKRTTASFQVDFTSDVIAKLARDREMLLNRLVEPKKKESTPRKPLHSLARRSSTSRIDQIVSIYQGSTKKLPSHEEFQSATEKIRHQLGIISPVKPSFPNHTLSPMEDLKLCSGKLTWSQRSLLKSELRKIGKDIFAPTHKVRDVFLNFAGELRSESANVDGISYLWMSNIKDVLEQRVRRLQECQNLDLGGNYKGKLFLFLVGDKGGNTTKIAIGMGNVRKANSLSSLLLVSLFDDDDGYNNLSNLEPVFHQLKFNKLLEHDVVWYLTGDLKFISSLYGHLGSSSVYPCMLCEALKEQFKEGNHRQSRNLFSIRCNFLTYNILTRNCLKLSAKEKVQVHRESKSIARVPLVRIPISNVIPPSLHIVQGLCQNVISWIEKAEPDKVSSLEDVYKSLGAQKQAWYQTFTGNHVRKLLTGDGPKKIACVVRCNEKHRAYERLLTLLGQIQSMAKSIFLSNEQVIMLGRWTNEFFLCLRENFPDASITPKCHLLCFHVVNFVKLHNFWGLLSEQSIESLHRKVNSDERRFASIKNRPVILKKLIEESYVRNVLFDLNIVLEIESE